MADKGRAEIISVGGGKGGVGKSIFSIALGVALSRRRKEVILADLDLGAANLHTYLGVLNKTPTIADFILKRASSLKDIVVETPVRGLGLISGAEFVPGMANPAHWMKTKIMRHIRRLPVDFVIMDLGAGVHFNTLDFFGMADRAVVVTAPEPGAVMNAYGFIKGAVFRKLQNIFRRHPVVGGIVEGEKKKTEREGHLTLEQLSGIIRESAPDMYPLIREINDSFKPSLVINRVPGGQTHILVRNLIQLCSDKIGISIDHIGNLPETGEVSHYLLNIPRFLDTEVGGKYFNAVEGSLSGLLGVLDETRIERWSRIDFTDDEIEELIGFIEGLDEVFFTGTNREIWKLRLFYRPEEVVAFLISRGVTHELFYNAPCRKPRPFVGDEGKDSN